jgi:ABC-type sugar transport system ATPase subunit
MGEIAKALSRNAKLVVLDEPSAVLGDQELERLFVTIKALAAQGICFIYVSHRLKEVFEIADRVTVLRDGSVVTTRPVADVNQEQLVNLMVGRNIEDFFPERVARPRRVALRVSGLRREGVLNDISLEAGTGEILGICGLAGSGRTELLRAMVGADRIDELCPNFADSPIGRGLAHAGTGSAGAVPSRANILETLRSFAQITRLLGSLGPSRYPRTHGPENISSGGYLPGCLMQL